MSDPLRCRSELGEGPECLKLGQLAAEDPSERHGWNVTKRGWLVLVSLTLPTLAIAWVLLFTHYERSGLDHGGRIVFAVVSKVDVPAGTDLNQLIKDEQLRIIMVPEEAAVDGTVTSVDQLKDRRNTVAILAGEPILAGQLEIMAERRRSALVSKAMTIGA
jgi:hypothetical protein